ncbi:MAG: NAD-dependent deacylase [Bdellovibrionaceae bacterium]|nr:NAD-dependent deacylase [Bdellovibrionales bacterium]MCB9085666.1 NAD-dependent deacylase [Pseudobdellovibrionaceae bacterium]
MSRDWPFSKTLRDLIANKASVCVLTGAGVSAESGVPTFREKDGLWAKFKPEELASMDAFMGNPLRVWEWYQHRLKVIREVQPNPGHKALAQWQRLVPDFTLLTQNVDGLHQRAGSENVLELHGNINRSFCVSCHHVVDEIELELLKEGGAPAKEDLPKCPQCQDLLRPDVVWFGEMLPGDILHASDQAARRCQLFLSIGTMGVVFPAAGLPLAAIQSGAYVVEINPDETELTPYMSESLRGPSGKILPQLIRLLAQP